MTPISRRTAFTSAGLAMLGASSSRGLAAAADAEPHQASTGQPRSICEFGVSATHSPEENRAALQVAMDWASPLGAALFVDPTDEPYPMAGGLMLRRNVSLVGVHGPVGRGTRHPTKAQPVGSVFRIEDESRPFLTLESATQVRGIQFWYPRQSISDPAQCIPYPPTIQVPKDHGVMGVTLACLTFYGEFITLDLAASSQTHPIEQMLVEHCYGYPLSGQFIRIDHCYDVPRVLHCHVNPGVQRFIAGDCTKPVIDAVVARGTFAYAVDHTDNAVLMDLFAYGVHGGANLGRGSYGQLTGFNFDCVTVGIHKTGESAVNRNWQIAQGCIIANAGPRVEAIHPIIVEGSGHVSIANVEAFSGPSDVLTTQPMSEDFMLVTSTEKLTASLIGCRMMNHRAERPITRRNEKAIIQMHGCFDKNEQPLNGLAP